MKTLNRLGSLLAYLFGCRHPRVTFPMRAKGACFAHVCCLDCGAEFGYSMERMQRVEQQGAADEHRR